jgi:hypothetical protein
VIRPHGFLLPPPLIGPAVVAAVISGLVSSIGILISARTSRAIHSERLAFERQQAERRINAEIALAERKFELDNNLAERKFRYDRDLHDHKRQVELAEGVLADFYRAKLIFEWVRSPGAFGDEGQTRKAEPGETPDQTRYRNALYAPIERLTHHNEFFAEMAARRFRFKALFGPDSDKPFDDLASRHPE